MSYTGDEAAHLDPVELFRFSFGGYFWRYTNADENVTAPDGEVYRAEPVLRSNMGITQEANTNNVTVSLAADNPVADLFTRTGMPMRHVWLTISRTHRHEDAEIATLFVGVASEAQFSGGVASIVFVPMRDAMAREIPYRLVGRLCANSLYDSQCRADPADFSNVVEVTAVNGLTMTVTGAEGRPTGYFNGGYLATAGLYRNATIREHIQPNTFLLLFNPGYTVGMQGVAYAGCDKKLETCRSKFDNVEHFQGFPFFPIVDPFKDGVS